MANQAAKHDYIARVEVSKGNFRYFYTQAEYDAYLHKDKPKQEDPTQKKSSFKEELSKRASAAKEEVKKKYSNTEDLISSMKNVTTDKIKPVSKEQDKTQEIKADKKTKSFLDKMGDKIADFTKEVSDAGKKFIDKVSSLGIGAEKERKAKLEEARKNTDEDDAITRKMKLDEANKLKKESLDAAYARSAVEPRAKLVDGTEVRHDIVTDRYFYKDKDGTMYYSSPDETVKFLGMEFTTTRTGFQNTDEYGNDHMKDSWLKKVDTTKKVEQRDAKERQAEVDKYRKDEPDFLKDVPRYDPPKSYDEIQDEMNERYIANKFYRNNCIFSTATYELKCRGYDVDVKDVHTILANNDTLTNTRAIGIDETGTKYVVTSNPHETMYENPESLNPATYSHNDGEAERRVTHKMIEKMYPPNSRGDISVIWVDDQGRPLGGHSMVFEIDKNGEMIIRDTQAHLTYTGREIDKLLARTDPAGTFTTRTDNLKFKKEFVNATRKN